ncbi:MAG TPA: FtsX-like permease family protein [Candidatus Binataceae bacterium]|nr:FtsX-like permease family protein [Candidatus Binataceae bacterium]
MAGKLLIIAIRNLRRQQKRAILTALSFAVAVFIYTVLVAVPISMDRIAQSASKGLRLIVTERNNRSLPVHYCGPIRNLPHVLGCAPEILWTGIYRDPRNAIVMYGVTPDLSTVTSSSDYQFPPAIVKQFTSDRRDAIVGSVLMKEQGWKLNEPVTLRDPQNAKLTLTVTPIVELPTEYLSRVFYFNRGLFDDAIKNLFGADIQNRASFLVVRVDRAENMGMVASAIDENFRNSDAETETETESGSVARVISGIGDVKPIIYGLCLVILLTMLLIAGNSMAMMVRDRTSEVAVMRALGFQRIHVAILLFTEAGLIGLTGAVLGAALALWRFGNGVSLGAVTGMMGYMEVRPQTAVAAVVAAGVVSLASAALPVIGATRITPAAAFRKVF